MSILNFRREEAAMFDRKPITVRLKDSIELKEALKDIFADYPTDLLASKKFRGFKLPRGRGWDHTMIDFDISEETTAFPVDKFMTKLFYQVPDSSLDDRNISLTILRNGETKESKLERNLFLMSPNSGGHLHIGSDKENLYLYIENQKIIYCRSGDIIGLEDEYIRLSQSIKDKLFFDPENNDENDNLVACKDEEVCKAVLNIVSRRDNAPKIKIAMHSTERFGTYCLANLNDAIDEYILERQKEANEVFLLGLFDKQPQVTSTSSLKTFRENDMFEKQLVKKILKLT